MPNNLIDITNLPAAILAETLSYLPCDDLLLSSQAGLRFFDDREQVFKIKLRDEFEVDWAACCEAFGAKNLCSTISAYRHLSLCYDTAGWNFEFSYSFKVVPVTHPYLPACVLKQLPEEKQHLGNLLAAWRSDIFNKNDVWCYGMKFSCLSGNLMLVQALVTGGYSKPDTDHFNAAIKNKDLSLVKYILANPKFGITPCAYSFELALSSGNLAVFDFLFNTLIPEYKLQIKEHILKSAQYILTKNADAPVHSIVNYLSEDEQKKSHSLKM
jgi:hypothetical protein